MKQRIVSYRPTRATTSPFAATPADLGQQGHPRRFQHLPQRRCPLGTAPWGTAIIVPRLAPQRRHPGEAHSPALDVGEVENRDRVVGAHESAPVVFMDCWDGCFDEARAAFDTSARPGDKVLVCGVLNCHLPRCAMTGRTQATWSSAACRRGNVVWDQCLRMGLYVARHAEDDGDITAPCA